MTDQENHSQAEQPEREPSAGPASTENPNPHPEKHHKGHNDDLLGSLSWALILIWAGLVFLASNVGWLEAIQVSLVLPEGFAFIGLGTWSVVFLGAGVIVFIEALVRTFVPSYRSNTSGTFFLAAIFLGLGLRGLFGWDLIWPFVLIALGFSALISALLQNRN